jgi:hypothetical protein
MIIYAFDERFEAVYRRASSRESATDYKIVTILETDSLHVAIEKIRQKARREQNIWLLRIVAHGYPGGMLIGSDFVNVGNASLFQELAPYFTPRGRGIELHSCNVASATSSLTPLIDVSQPGTSRRLSDSGTPDSGTGGVGGAFLQALATATGVSVVAGYDTQFIDSGFRWEGRGTMTVEPSGTSATTVGADVRPQP